MDEEQPADPGASDIKKPEASVAAEADVESDPVSAAPDPAAGLDTVGPGSQAPGVEAAPPGGEAPAEFIDLDQPPPGLPELTFPGSEPLEDREAAAQRRAKRLRIELSGGGILLLIGVAAAVVTGTAAALVLVIIVLGAVVAYEFLVTNLE